MATSPVVTFTAIPYCGTAPLPTELWTRWNFDPWVLIGLAALAWAGWAHGRNDSRGRLALSISLAFLCIMFISPLCALASALFSARVAHHLLLIAVAAPLLAIVFPVHRADAATDRGPRISLTALTLMHAAVVWTWHAPAPYRHALSSDLIYWVMQSSLLLSAWWLWRRILWREHVGGAALLALLGTVMQMGLLGALLVFAPRAVFTPHFGQTLPYGITALQDQQLAGLLMWMPATLPYLAAALMLSIHWLRTAPQVQTR